MITLPFSHIRYINPQVRMCILFSQLFGEFFITYVHCLAVYSSRRRMISRAMRVCLSRARQGWTSQTKRTGLAWKEGASQRWWRELELRERLSELLLQREQFLWPEPCQQSRFLKSCKISGQKRIGLISTEHSVNANTTHKES